MQLCYSSELHLKIVSTVGGLDQICLDLCRFIADLGVLQIAAGAVLSFRFAITNPSPRYLQVWLIADDHSSVAEISLPGSVTPPLQAAPDIYVSAMDRSGGVLSPAVTMTAAPPAPAAAVAGPLRFQYPAQDSAALQVYPPKFLVANISQDNSYAGACLLNAESYP